MYYYYVGHPQVTPVTHLKQIGRRVDKFIEPPPLIPPHWADTDTHTEPLNHHFPLLITESPRRTQKEEHPLIGSH